MKRIFISLTMLLFTAGCSNSGAENDIEKIHLSDLYPASQEHENAIKNMSCDNITIDDTFYLDVPDCNEASTFTLKIKPALSADILKKYAGDVVSDNLDYSVDIDENLWFTSEKIKPEPNLPYPLSMPLLSEHPDIDMKNVSTFVIGSSDYYIEIRQHRIIPQ